MRGGRDRNSPKREVLDLQGDVEVVAQPRGPGVAVGTWGQGDTGTGGHGDVLKEHLGAAATAKLVSCMGDAGTWGWEDVGCGDRGYGDGGMGDMGMEACRDAGDGDEGT